MVGQIMNDEPMLSPTSQTPFAPLTREGLVDRVANLITEAILAGRIRPGDRLSESTIARDLAVSRAPVREAARVLESSGLVLYRPNRGFFVRELSSEAIDNLYEYRIVIERAAITRLVREGVAGTVQRLEKQLAELYRVAEAEEPMQQQIEADMTFHRLICEGSGNPRFLTAFDQIANETTLGLMLIGRLYDDPKEMAETHMPILDAIRAGDAAASEAAIEFHIGTARKLVCAHFRQLEDQKR